MAQQNLNRAQASPVIPTLKINDITPKNWHRFPPRIAPSNPVNVPTVAFSGGAANAGAAAGNGGEVGTIASTTVSRGQPWTNQAEKAAAIGTTMAVDVTKSYHGTRGDIEPHERYPSANTSETAAAFLPSNYVAQPVVIP